MYGNTADWISYATARGNNAPANASGTDASAALVRASDYIRTRYILRLAPAYDENSEETIEATYIAASLELATPGFWSTTFTPAQTKVLTKVDSISWTPVDTGKKGADAMIPVSPAIDALFAGALAYGVGLYVV